MSIRATTPLDEAARAGWERLRSVETGGGFGVLPIVEPWHQIAGTVYGRLWSQAIREALVACDQAQPTPTRHVPVLTERQVILRVPARSWRGRSLCWWLARVQRRDGRRSL